MTESEPQSQKDANDLIGRQISQFDVLEEIGRGGMATVYRATQKSINRDVALKVLPRTFLHDPGFLERFNREVEVIAHLEHPHIVPIYDYGEANGMPYIAMRFLAGGSFRRLIRDGVRDLRDLVRPVSQVAQALDHAHAAGIIHRDLKPGNILLDTSGNAYLSDFGIARVLDSDLTGSAIIGTPTYMSPEQANGDPLDARSDVYALGIVVFELITGREPFQAATPIAMLLKQINERVPSLTEFRRNIPEELDRVIAKATEKKRDDRYASAGEMAEAFAAAVRAMDTTELRPVRDDDDTLPPTKPINDEQRASIPSPTPTNDLDGVTLTPETEDITRDKLERAQMEMDGPATMATPAPMHPSQSLPADPKPRPLWAYSAIALLLFVVAGAGVLVLNPFSQPVSLAASVPLYAEGVQVIENENYALGLPIGFSAVTNTTDGMQVWRNAEGTLAVGVEMVPLAGTDFSTATVVYMNTYPDADLIDMAEGDSYQRFSVRRVETEDTLPGQDDVYLAVVGDAMMVVQLYTADTAPAESVQMLQAVLDSVRVMG